MNEHDRDLILGLADGSLTGDDAAAARARIDADPTLAAELAIQEAVRADLDALPSVGLTEAERSDLRAGLRTQLRLDDAPPAVATVPERRRTFRWQPVFGLGAAAVFIAAVVILPGTLGGSSDDSSDEALVETTVAAFDVVGGEGDADVGDGAEEDATSDANVAENGAPPADASARVPELDQVDGADLLGAVRQAETPEQLSESIAPRTTGPLVDVDLESAEQCLEQLGNRTPDGDKTLMGADETDDGMVVYFAVLLDGAESVITVNLDSCTIVDIDR